MKKTAAIVLMLALCLSAAAAQAFSLTGFETDTVDREWGKNAFFSRMQELTGIAVQPVGIADETEYTGILDDMLKGKVATDALFKANLSRSQEYALLESGAIMDLAPLIDAHMPNLSALLAAHPEWRAMITLDDGRIASLPLINEKERQVCLWINSAWLEKLGIAMPQNLQELTKALIAIRDGDPNGNGKHDEIGADLLGVYEMRWLLPYFGVVADDYNLARDAQGNIVFAPELPQYREFIGFLREWYVQGILREDAFTGTHGAQALSETKDETAVSGLLLSMTPFTHVPANHMEEYHALLMPAQDGAMYWRDMLGEIWPGCFAVTKACADPGEALSWVDALYAQEGALLAYAGLEGTDYQVNADGSWAFITDNYRTVNNIRAEAIIYTGTTAPGLYPADFVYSVDSAMDRHVFAQSERVRAVSTRVTPPYALDRAAQEKANALSTVLCELVDRGIARFATGEVELNDETYAAWLDELHAAGSEELAALFAD